jgi:hypothetical protein
MPQWHTRSWGDSIVVFTQKILLLGFKFVMKISYDLAAKLRLYMKWFHSQFSEDFRPGS